MCVHECTHTRAHILAHAVAVRTQGIGLTPLGKQASIERHLRPLFLTFFFFACSFETNSHFLSQAGLKRMALFLSFLSPEVITTSTPGF